MRHKLPDATILTEAGIERLVAEIADLDAKQAKTQSSIDTLLSDQADALDKIRAEYLEPLTKLAEKANAFEAMRDAKLAIVKGWADSRKGTLFAKKRSFSFQRGTIGYNLGKAKLEVVEGESFESVAAKLRITRGGKAYVEMKPTLKKAGILKAWESATKLFEKVGLVRKQEDEFYFRAVEQTPDSLKAAA